MADLVATAEPFTLNSGSPNIATLKIGGQTLAQAIVTAIHQTDWQGRIALSNQPRTNFAQQSDNPLLWAAAAVTLTSSSTVAPNGKTAALAVPTTTNTTHLMRPASVSPSLTAGQPVAFTVVAKYAGYGLVVQITQSSGGVNGIAAVDLSSGAVSVTSQPVYPFTVITTPLANGWWRIEARSQTVATGTAPVVAIYPSPSNLTIFTGDGTSGVLLSVSDVDQAAAVGVHIPTTTAPVTVTDYTQNGAQVTLGQNPATGATPDWDGSGILPGQNWSWPLALPQTPFGNDSPTYKPADNILRTQMQGATKTRPLFTAVPEMITVTLLLSPAQRATLDTFLKSTLKYTLPFDWLDFRTGLTATYAYGGTAMPTEQYLGADAAGTWWRVQFDLELQP